MSIFTVFDKTWVLRILHHEYLSRYHNRKPICRHFIAMLSFVVDIRFHVSITGLNRLTTHREIVHTVYATLKVVFSWRSLGKIAAAF